MVNQKLSDQTSSNDKCSNAFTVTGNFNIDGLYELQADIFNDDVYYLREKPTIMYAYRNATGPAKNNWHFDSELGNKVSTILVPNK